MEKFVMAGGIALHYSDTCKGDKSILLLHGYLESLSVWEDFIPLLSARGFRVITLDLPGHGVSEVVSECHTMEFLADTINSLLEKISVDKCCVVGHSMGGYVALELANKYPQRVSSLVLFSSTPNADTDEKRDNRSREIEIVRSGRKELLSRTVPKKGFAPENRKKFTEEIEELALGVMLTEDEGVIALLCGMSERKDMNEMLRGLQVPKLFIFGKKDEHISVEVAETIAQNHPQAKVEWLENSGHNGFIEEPVRSAEVISSLIC